MGQWQRILPGDTIVEIANNSDSDAHENVDNSEGDDLCEIEESTYNILCPTSLLPYAQTQFIHMLHR
jgi:hypothetical protein